MRERDVFLRASVDLVIIAIAVIIIVWVLR